MNPRWGKLIYHVEDRGNYLVGDTPNSNPNAVGDIQTRIDDLDFLAYFKSNQ